VYNSLGFPVVRLLHSYPHFNLIKYKVNYTEKLLIDYRYMDAMGIIPQYEFGFGLSYTTFKYSGLEITSAGSGTSSAVVVAFTVTNSGVFCTFPILRTWESRSVCCAASRR
jgi:hypothetical protein